MNSSVSSLYSDSFKAIWEYVMNNTKNNPTIYKIKESTSSMDCFKKGPESHISQSMYIVSQQEEFIIDEGIYAVCKFFKEDSENEKMSTKTEKIQITIYSFKYSVSHLQNYINKITLDYLSTIKSNRLNKKFIYTLEKTTYNEEELRLGEWSETPFYSCRNFSNMFFENKHFLLKQIDFFINNREWYETRGIPWTCGIGLHGPPGTGKTSFIKALANYTNTHLVFMSLKLIKTKQQLEKFFFEDRYNNNNEKNSITFSNKIIVFEDIDCVSDIVLNREDKFKNNSSSNNCLENKSENDMVKLGDVVKSVFESKAIECLKTPTLPNQPEPLTLDDILNLWDGVRETPGRIMIITSNHYDKLDPALIRPGRIDITHCFNNTNHCVIEDMYKHLFQKDNCQYDLNDIEEYLYSPAEITNIYLSTRSEEKFIERLKENRKP
jgi:SpoVK/Ycf46/Vps4 family AAA+-type ATPase